MGLLEPSKRPSVATGYPPLRAALGHRSFHLSPEVLALEGLWCPFHPRLATSSARLETSASLPSTAGYSDGLWHARTCLPGLHTFRTFAVVLSRIAACSLRRESGTCTPILPYQHWLSGRGKTPLAPPTCPPSAPRGDPLSTAPNGELRRQDLHLQVQQLVSLRSLPWVPWA
jgi:hypothetical protein